MKRRNQNGSMSRSRNRGEKTLVEDDTGEMKGVRTTEALTGNEPRQLTVQSVSSVHHQRE